MRISLRRLITGLLLLSLLPAALLPGAAMAQEDSVRITVKVVACSESLASTDVGAIDGNDFDDLGCSMSSYQGDGTYTISVDDEEFAAIPLGSSDDVRMLFPAGETRIDFARLDIDYDVEEPAFLHCEQSPFFGEISASTGEVPGNEPIVYETATGDYLTCVLWISDSAVEPVGNGAADDETPPQTGAGLVTIDVQVVECREDLYGVDFTTLTNTGFRDLGCNANSYAGDGTYTVEVDGQDLATLTLKAGDEQEGEPDDGTAQYQYGVTELQFDDIDLDYDIAPGWLQCTFWSETNGSNETTWQVPGNEPVVYDTLPGDTLTCTLWYPNANVVPDPNGAVPGTTEAGSLEISVFRCPASIVYADVWDLADVDACREVGPETTFTLTGPDGDFHGTYEIGGERNSASIDDLAPSLDYSLHVAGMDGNTLYVLDCTAANLGSTFYPRNTADGIAVVANSTTTCAAFAFPDDRALIDGESDAGGEGIEGDDGAVSDGGGEASILVHVFGCEQSVTTETVTMVETTTSCVTQMNWADLALFRNGDPVGGPWVVGHGTEMQSLDGLPSGDGYALIATGADGTTSYAFDCLDSAGNHTFEVGTASGLLTLDASSSAECWMYDIYDPAE